MIKLLMIVKPIMNFGAHGLRDTYVKQLLLEQTYVKQIQHVK